MMRGFRVCVTPRRGVTHTPGTAFSITKNRSCSDGRRTHSHYVASAAFNLFASVLPFPENSALPYRVSASYGGCEPHISAVQPFQVMTTRRRFSQVTETLACRYPKALVSACAILPGNIGAGLPYSEQTPLPKASVHAVK